MGQGTSAAGDPPEQDEWASAEENPPLDEIEEISETESAAAEHLPNRARIQYWPNNCIFQAPVHIRSAGRESYFEPKLVSIGPYYHGRENLRRMEYLKLQCIPEIREKQRIQRSHARARPSEACIRRSIYNVPLEPSTEGERGIDDEPLTEFEDSGCRARGYYKEEFNHSANDFIRMLVLDSCFIIRIIFTLYQQVQESMAFLDVHIKDVRSDLLLLENQIPLFFIREVYKWLFPTSLVDQNFPPFNTVLEPFICLDMPWRINHDAMSSDAVHLLDLYWRCSMSPPMYMELCQLERDLSNPERDCSEQEQPSWAEIHLSDNTPMMIANATELQKMVGIEFKKFKDKGHLDVCFSKGIMRMPRLKIDLRQITLLMNLIAFENCILPSMRIISCYMKVMDALIDSEKDVELLQKCNVIYNTLSNHETAATFLNGIGNFCFIDYKANRFSGLYKNVQEYYNSTRNRRCASLQQKYFSSPWAGMSVFAAVILLLLSLAQTFYAIYGYHHPNNGSPGSN